MGDEVAGYSLGGALSVSVEGEDGSEIGQREELSCDEVPTQASAAQRAEGSFHRLLSAGESKR